MSKPKFKVGDTVQVNKAMYMDCIGQIMSITLKGLSWLYLIDFETGQWEHLESDLKKV
jgi:hypothetical protein